MRIFISYRRDDIDVVSRIRERLSARFPHVFQDTDAILPGHDFNQATTDELSDADVVLVVIGRDWIRQARDTSKPDWVRFEVEQTLARTPPPRVFPVLVRDGDLPAKDELPPSMQPLLNYQATRIASGADFDFHVERLIAAIGKGTQRVPARLRVATPLGILALAAVAWGTWHLRVAQQHLEAERRAAEELALKQKHVEAQKRALGASTPAAPSTANVEAPEQRTPPVVDQVAIEPPPEQERRGAPKPASEARTSVAAATAAIGKPRPQTPVNNQNQTNPRSQVTRGWVIGRSVDFVGGPGHFDRSVVFRTIRARIRAMQQCYERGLLRKTKLGGKVRIELTIQVNGTVTGAIRETSGDPVVDACMEAVVTRLRFNPGPKGGSVTYAANFELVTSEVRPP